jgi:hypothetical protein
VVFAINSLKRKAIIAKCEFDELYSDCGGGSSRRLVLIGYASDT